MKDAEKLKIDAADVGAPIEMKDLMPPGFIKKLSASTGLKDPANISKLVNFEQTTRRGWPAVVELAKENNPEGYARWEAARQQVA